MKSLQIGLLITLIASVAYAVIETVYVIYINPDFYANLTKYDLEQYRKALSAAQFAAKQKAKEKQLAISNNPIYNFFMMVIVIGSLGTVITVISSLILKSRTKVVATID